MYHCSVSTSTLVMADRTSHYRRVLRIALKTRVFINSTLTGLGLCPVSLTYRVVLTREEFPLHKCPKYCANGQPVANALITQNILLHNFSQ